MLLLFQIIRLSSCIDKRKYLNTIWAQTENVYNISLSFILERVVYYLNRRWDRSIQLHIVIEQRGKKEDNLLCSHLEKILKYGTRDVF